MLRTVLLSLALLGGGFSAAAWLTHDFQVWTDEGARRLEVALRPVPVPAVTVDGTGIAPSALPQLLATPGHVTIADFFYTRCKTVCLTLGSSFAQLQAALAQDNPGVQLLSISFDGGHDTPNILRHYARPLGADPATWRRWRGGGPTGPSTLLRRPGGGGLPPGFGDYEHNAALLVFDAQGRMVRVFDLAEQDLALNYARHLARQAQHPSAQGAV